VDQATNKLIGLAGKETGPLRLGKAVARRE